MNKIAICFSGGLRTFKICYKTIINKFKHLGKVDLFISTWEKPCYTQVKRFEDIYAIDGDNKVIKIDRIDFDRKFEHDYRLEVSQFIINRGAYEFWEGVKKQAEIQGGLFDPTPSSVSGNLNFENEEEELVVGYFGVYREKTTIIHLNQNDFSYSTEAQICTSNTPAGPPPSCSNCFDSRQGKFITNQKPNNW